jgi:hypothetical protein
MLRHKLTTLVQIGLSLLVLALIAGCQPTETPTPPAPTAPVPTPTEAPPGPTPTPSRTFTPGPTPTPTGTPTPGPTPTPTRTATNAPTSTATNTPTPAGTATNTPMPTPAGKCVPPTTNFKLGVNFWNDQVPGLFGAGGGYVLVNEVADLQKVIGHTQFTPIFRFDYSNNQAVPNCIAPNGQICARGSTEGNCITCNTWIDAFTRRIDDYPQVKLYINVVKLRLESSL